MELSALEGLRGLGPPKGLRGLRGLERIEKGGRLGRLEGLGRLGGLGGLGGLGRLGGLGNMYRFIYIDMSIWPAGGLVGNDTKSFFGFPTTISFSKRERCLDEHRVELQLLLN